MSGPTDIRGVPLKVGDTVAYAALNYKRARIRVGTIKGTRAGYGGALEFLVSREDAVGRSSSWQRPGELLSVPAGDPKEDAREQAFQEAVS